MFMAGMEVMSLISPDSSRAQSDLVAQESVPIRKWYVTLSRCGFLIDDTTVPIWCHRALQLYVLHWECNIALQNRLQATSFQKP